MAANGTVNSAAPDAETQRRLFHHMLRARVLDERIWVLNRQGRAPFWISGMGHEAIQVAMAMHIRPGHDWLACYYRDLAMTLVLGMTPRDHLLSALARSDDPNSGARQMPAHYGCRRLNIITTGSPVATQVLHAAGTALASKIRGEDAVSVTSLGEGSTSGGDFHEALNFAATRRLPLICLVENNGYAISVPWQKQMPTEDVADRARAYGIPGVRVDGGDAFACYLAAGEAVARARRGDGPTLIEAKVQRLTSHSSDDDEKRYRTSESIAETRAHDCMARLRSLLEETGVLAPGEALSIRTELVRELDQALAGAEESPYPDPQTALLQVLAEEF